MSQPVAGSSTSHPQPNATSQLTTGHTFSPQLQSDNPRSGMVWRPSPVGYVSPDGQPQGQPEIAQRAVQQQQRAGPVPGSYGGQQQHGGRAAQVHARGGQRDRLGPLVRGDPLRSRLA